MRLQTAILLVTLSLTAAWAAPAKLQHTKRSFKVNLVRRSNHVPDGPTALRRAYKKFHWEVPQSLTQSRVQAGTEAGDAPATPDRGDTEYLSPVNIGGQSLMLNFDTGSSDMWVFSTELPSTQTRGHTAYDPSKSSTFRRIDDAAWTIRYGDGSGARGTVGTDTVNIGGATVTRQAVELATALSQSFVRDLNSDGLLGLGFSKLNTVKPTQQKTFFDNVMADLAQPVFTANLRRDDTGSYEFGNIDTSKFAGDLTYIPIDNSRGWWEFASTRFSVDGQEQQNPNPSPAIADTGTSLMLVDDFVAEAYYSKVKGAKMDQDVGGYIYPCSSKLPDFAVAIGDSYMAVVPGSGINFAPVDSTETTCFGGIQNNEGQNIQIYGDVLFRAQFVVFDGGQLALGFAPHRK